MHVPVLAGPALEWLCVRDNGVYVDCTAGAGGHSALIAERLTTGRLIALDRDASAVELAGKRLEPWDQAEVVHANYGELSAVLAERNITTVDGVLLDAGVSSMQLDDARRGFSLQEEGPLDMRMDTSQELTAATFLAGISADELVGVLKAYGDVPRAGRIARTILEHRDKGTLNTTLDLSAAVGEALGLSGKVPQEAYTTFQAIRMAVNAELDSLKTAVEAGVECLAPGGRFVAIAFHSGEDRVVKNVLRDLSRPQRELAPGGQTISEEAPLIKVLTKKPVRPDADETRQNPRARSACLRAAERLAA
jgi:16S rRNA (cytosine1402-N4)-methyltransferase